nr:MAG TPA: Cro/C1-type HTH DNA-binding domain protein [Caudoviricetes sp.]
MGIGSILSALIEEKGSNVNKVAQEASISPQTLYSMIRRDSMKVDIEVLIRICRVLDVPVEYVYNKYKGEEKAKQPLFSPHETKLIKKYRALDDNGRATVDSVLNTLYAQQTDRLVDSSDEITAS